MTLSLQHPFMAIVAGPTGCGKTRFVVRLVENVSKMIEPIPDKIMYCYSEFQSLFSQYPQVKFHESLPDVTKFDGQQRILLIIDDLMLFTNGSHHRNVSCTSRKTYFTKTDTCVPSVWTRTTWYCLKIREMPVSFLFWLGRCILILADPSLSKKRTEMPQRDHSATSSWTWNLSRTNNIS